MKILKTFLVSVPLALTMACGTDIDQQDQDDRQVLEQHEKQSDQNTDRSMRSREGEQGIASAQSSSAVSIDHLIGSAVRTRDSNREVGTLEDILTDSNGEPIAAVISIGEFLGIGEKEVAVDWETITVVPDNENTDATFPSDDANADNQNRQSGDYGDQPGTMEEFHSPDGYSILVNMTEQTLKDAPEFERTWD